VQFCADDSHKKQKISPRKCRFVSQSGKSKYLQVVHNISRGLCLTLSRSKNCNFCSRLFSAQMILLVVATGFIPHDTGMIVLLLAMTFPLDGLVIPILDYLENYACLTNLFSSLLVYIGMMSLPFVLTLPLKSFLNKVIACQHLYRNQIESLSIDIKQGNRRLALNFAMRLLGVWQ